MTLQKQLLKQLFIETGRILFMLVLINSSILAQPINTLVGDVVQPTPGAASLGQYGDIPVGYATGTPSISIPLQGIQEGKLSLPISLNYHGSGIKVAQMASWVGLGWSLSAGGSISRTVIGRHDESAKGYYNTTFDVSNGGNFCTGGADDSEPDIFVINLPTVSAKFFIDMGGDIKLVDKTSQLQVELIDINSSLIFDGFKVTTPDGTIYSFGYDNQRVARELINVNNTGSYINEWKLLHIETYDGSDHIYFDYVSEGYNYQSLSNCTKRFGYVSSNSINQVICPSSSGIHSLNGYSHRFNNHSISGMRLSKIRTGSQTKEMIFYGSTNRTDLGGNAKRLDKIEYKTGNTTNLFCKQYDFSYSHFEDRSHTSIISKRYSKRLKLDAIAESSCFGQEALQPYSFTYQGPINSNGTSYLPHRLSKQIDHWGYFNAKTANDNLDVLVPATTLNTGQNNEDSYGCADRSPNMTVMNYGVLKEIIYPHKGSNSFIYEPHKVSALSTDLAANTTKIATCGTLGPNCCGLLSMQSAPISFISQTQINTTTIDLNIAHPVPQCSGSGQPYIRIEAYQGNNMYVNGHTFVLPSGKMSDTETINLSSLSNTFKPSVDYTFKIISFRGRGEATLDIYENPMSVSTTIGGLRIDTIISYDGMDHARDIITSYDYTQAGASSGVLLGSPVYGASAFDLQCGTFQYEFLLEWNGTPTTSLSEYEGRHIIYKRVVAKVKGQGYTEFIYDADPNPFPTAYALPLPPQTQISGGLSANFVVPPRVFNYANGRLKSVKSYSENTTVPVREELYEPSFASGYENAAGDVFKFQCFNECTINGFPQYRLGLRAYKPRSGWYLLGKKTTKQDGVTTVESYTYNTAAGHYSPKTVTITNSDNLKHITVYSYPEDYRLEENGTIGMTMKDQNLILPPWKTEKYITNTSLANKVDGTKTLWKDFGTAIYPEKGERWEKTFNVNGADFGTPSWEPQYTITSYNTSVGRPSVMNYHMWSNQYFEWTTSGQMKKDSFLNHVKEYSYFTDTDLLSMTKHIDSTTMSYTYDGLIRPHTITDDQRERTETIDYHYSAGMGDRSYTEVSTFYKKLGENSMTLVNRTFYDGLGRTIQINKKGQGTATNQSVIISTEYDAQGRVVHAYEPRSVTNNLLNYEGYAGAKKTTTYEASPLSRPISVVDASGFTMNYEYGTNNGSNTIAGLSNNLYFRTTQTDGRGHKTHTFVDRLGKQILHRRQDGNDVASKADTRTYYDKKLRPVKIVPPDAVSSHVNLVTSYLYYGNDKIRQQKLPDSDYIEYKYDARDLLISSQDGEQRLAGRWHFYKLDNYGRIIKEGWSLDGTSLTTEYLENGWSDSGVSAGKITQQRIRMTCDPTEYNDHNMTYDNAGRLIKKEYSTFLMSQQKAVKETYTYDSADNILTQSSNLDSYALDPYSYQFTYNYDHAGRPFTSRYGKDNTATNLLSTKYYTQKDQIVLLKIGNNLQNVNFRYLSNQFLHEINGDNLGSSDLFQSDLAYDAAGNISRLDWHTRGETSSYYDYEYDFLNRIVSADHNGNANNAFSSSYVYDDYRGNLKSIKRNSNQMGVELDNMTFKYNDLSNCISNITETGSQGLVDAGYSVISGNYVFNKNGALTYDPSRKITIVNEHFNLPHTMTKDASNRTTYFYDWLGTLHRTKTITNGVLEQRDYVGAAEYVNGKLDLIKHETGYIKPDIFNNGLLQREGDTDHDDIKYWETIHSEEIELPQNGVELYFENYGQLEAPFEVKEGAEYLMAPSTKTGEQFFWNIKDHLGNVRVVFDNDLNILEKNNYYAFGMRWTDQQPQFNYTYNGKEEQRGVGSGLLAYGARFYDPSIGRFTGVDPLADHPSQVDKSPYAYAFNNPINLIDPDGRMPIDPIYAHQEFKRRVDNIARRVTESIDNATSAVGDVFSSIGNFLASPFREGTADGNSGNGDALTTDQGVTIHSNSEKNSAGANPAPDGDGSTVIISTDEILTPGNSMTSKAASKSSVAINAIDKASRGLKSTSDANSVVKEGHSNAKAEIDTIEHYEWNGSTYTTTKPRS